MKLRHLLLLGSLLQDVLAAPAERAGWLQQKVPIKAKPRIIGYYDARSQKELPPDSIPFQNLTHLVVTNALQVDDVSGFHLAPSPGPGLLAGEALLKYLASKPVHVIVSIRGSPDDVALDELAESNEFRAKFVQSIAKKLEEWGLAGIEVEWHSDDPEGGKALAAPFDLMEQYHFALLCRDLKTALAARGNMTLSVSVRPGRQEFAKAEFVRNHLDWLSLRAYSMRSLGDPHHTSLKDMERALDEWVQKGVHKTQLVLGIPLFGRPGAALNVASKRHQGLRKPWSVINTEKHFIQPGGAGGDMFLDLDTGKVWYTSGVNTTRAKVQQILRQGYGGLALRDLHQDLPATSTKSLLQVVAGTVADFKNRQKRPGLRRQLSLFQQGFQRFKSLGGSGEHQEF